MGFEQTIDKAVNEFTGWAWQFEIIIGIICAVIYLGVGIRYLKRDKKNAGYIWFGIGILIILLDVVKGVFSLLLLRV